MEELIEITMKELHQQFAQLAKSSLQSKLTATTPAMKNFYQAKIDAYNDCRDRVKGLCIKYDIPLPQNTPTNAQ